MTNDPRRLLQLQPVAYDEPATRRPTSEPPPFIDFDLDRPFGSHHRRRVLLSAQHLVALFDYDPGERRQRLH